MRYAHLRVGGYEKRPRERKKVNRYHIALLYAVQFTRGVRRVLRSSSSPSFPPPLLLPFSLLVGARFVI